jgi:hypothetical protein
MFTLGFLTAASADVATVDNFTVILNGATIFSDSFGAGLTLAGGNIPGTILPSGQNFSNGMPANYNVIGTVTETGNKAILDTARGALTDFGPPYPPFYLNDADVQTGPPTSPLSLTPNDAFRTTALFDVTVPPTLGGFYQVELSNASNMGPGDIISVDVHNCSPGGPVPAEQCGSATGPVIQLYDANFAVNPTIRTLIAQTPLDASNQQILLELSHPTPAHPMFSGRMLTLTAASRVP